jgi:L-rhamnose mutarotase
VIAYVECEPTVEAALAAVSTMEVQDRWNKYIRAIMTKSVDEHGRFFSVPEIWHMD